MIFARLLLLCLLATRLCGDSFSAAKPRTITSPNGLTLLRIQPPDDYEKGLDWGGTVCIIYQKKETAFEEIVRFSVNEMAKEVFVNNLGTRVVFVDPPYGNINTKPLLVVFDGSGKKLKEWGWMELFGLNGLGEIIRGNSKTESMWESLTMRRWYDSCSWSHDCSELTILPALSERTRQDGKREDYFCVEDPFTNFVLGMTPPKLTLKNYPKQETEQSVPPKSDRAGG